MVNCKYSLHTHTRIPTQQFHFAVLNPTRTHIAGTRVALVEFPVRADTMLEVVAAARMNVSE